MVTTRSTEEESLIFIEAVNGENRFTESKARMGYLAPKYYISITDRYVNDCKVASGAGYAQVPNFSTTRFRELFVMNAYKLIKAGLSDIDATATALFRTIGIQRGALLRDSDRVMKPTEVVTEVSTTNDLLVDVGARTYTGSGTYAEDAIVLRILNVATNALISDCYMLFELIMSLIFLYFNKTGHHVRKMSLKWFLAMLKKCQVQLLSNLILNFDILYYSFHPFGMKRIKELIGKDEFKKMLPDVVLKRINGAPAGTASLCTGAAILDAMKATSIYTKFYNRKRVEIDGVLDMRDEIKSNPTKYHVISEFFGVAPLTNDEKRRLEKARGSTERWAPLLLAYLNVFASRSPLAEQKALDKHAEANDGLRLTFEMAFRKEYQKMSTASNLDELFSSL